MKLSIIQPQSNRGALQIYGDSAKYVSNKCMTSDSFKKLLYTPIINILSILTLHIYEIKKDSLLSINSIYSKNPPRLFLADFCQEITYVYSIQHIFR